MDDNTAAAAGAAAPPPPEPESIEHKLHAMEEAICTLLDKEDLAGLVLLAGRDDDHQSCVAVRGEIFPKWAGVQNVPAPAGVTRSMEAVAIEITPDNMVATATYLEGMAKSTRAAADRHQALFEALVVTLERKAKEIDAASAAATSGTAAAAAAAANSGGGSGDADAT